MEKRINYEDPHKCLLINTTENKYRTIHFAVGLTYWTVNTCQVEFENQRMDSATMQKSIHHCITPASLHNTYIIKCKETR